jgi:hypothetical protein
MEIPGWFVANTQRETVSTAIVAGALDEPRTPPAIVLQLLELAKNLTACVDR